MISEPNLHPSNALAQATDSVQSPTQDKSGLNPVAEKALAASTYAGDVSPRQAWTWVQAGEAVLVDVRSDAERAWVGFVPGADNLAWKQWPSMTMNPDFDVGIARLKKTNKKLVMLCRSGVRSIAAAQRATELGAQAYNILEGFEGDLDAQTQQRGKHGGWRFHGLPWQQS